jgi:hypothetical protein
MGITHDLAFLDSSVFLKQARHLGFGELWVNASHEKVGAGVDRVVIIFRAVLVRLDAVQLVSVCCCQGIMIA